jgi:hypothetical protein
VALGEIPEPKLVEVHRDMEPVPGSLTFFPGNRFVTFRAERRYSYEADLYVTVTYDSQELSRLTFKVKPIPTIVAGVVADHLGTQIEGLTVSLAGTGQSVKTDNNGNYNLRFDGAESLPSGRYRLVFNPDMKDPSYGTIEGFANIRGGRLNAMSTYLVPLLNREIPYVQLKSGQGNALVARGNVELDLSDATLLFPDGRDRGNVHIQFHSNTQLSFSARESARPNWMYSVQPGGVKVSGAVGVTIQMPKLWGSYDYIPPDGVLVAMLGLNPDTKVIEPVGIGRVSNRQVVSVGKLAMKSLNYIGYAFVSGAAYPVLLKYESGEITSLTQLISGLDAAAP